MDVGSNDLLLTHRLSLIYKQLLCVKQNLKVITTALRSPSSVKWLASSSLGAPFSLNRFNGATMICSNSLLATRPADGLKNLSFPEPRAEFS